MRRLGLIAIMAAISCRLIDGLRGQAVCKTLSGLTRRQQDSCRRHPDLTLAAVEGLSAAATECQHQFRWHRWNCSSLAVRAPHNSHILARGFRESAFAHAITAAAVAERVARACASGRVLECGCGPERGAAGAGWKWGGCSHNIRTGLAFSQEFLDVKESNNGDIQSRVSLHNNEAGRLAVAKKMEVKCKCHGVSGSCELRTCWRSAPDLRTIGVALKERFREAIMVEESNKGGGGLAVRRRRKKKKKRRKRPRDLRGSLLYYEKSPSFCEPVPGLEAGGTTGRICKKGGRGVDGCASLCCGRGYNIIRRRLVDRCNCKFHWCCYVTCSNCTVDEWITVCK
ncbi:protein Wnt-10b isoform X2 [Halyomorpha halys]|uniref:protein Wnt-10b isoform X2 n=1 Tax=Halyomorpha halys TaxID=286706 RepID=UPI0006D4DC03|nr:protein Wnt-10b isoform X2 [Halyomorpha halys]